MKRKDAFYFAVTVAAASSFSLLLWWAIIRAWVGG